MHVAIIGGGLAGLSAARTLVEHGVYVDLYEATHRLGGRARTAYPPDADLPMEMGPEFVHGDPELTCTLVGEPRIQIDELPERSHLISDGELVSLDVWSRFAKLLRNVDDKHDESARAYIERIRPKAEDADLLARFIEGFYGAELDDVSIANIAADAGGVGSDASPGGFHVHGGYGEVIARFEDGIKRARVHLGCPVERVVWQTRSVKLEHARGTAHADRVIVTVPLSVLQANALRFEPAIVRPPLDKLAMGQVVKLVLRLREPVWAGHSPGHLDFVHGGGVFPTYWMRSRKATTLLVAWAGGSHARALVGVSVASLIEQALDGFAQLTGVSRGRLALAVSEYGFHDYARDPYARGAYSYARVGAGDAGAELAQPVANTIFFAGEATDVDYEGTVAGAMASGARAAREALATRDQSLPFRHESLAPVR
jgi:monoamine oxidase